jgi:uncharacterized membrane protein
MRARRLLIHIRGSLWFVPVVCVLAGALLSFATIAVDRAFDYDAIPGDVVGSPQAAALVLSTVAASMVSLAALVLTITMVVVQLAMGQFSPRIVQRILRDKPSQFAIGLFVATFVHAILALREVHEGPNGTGKVPEVAIVTAFVLVLASVAVLVVYVHHIGQALRVSALIELVGKETRGLLDRRYPDKGPQPESRGNVIRARQSGVVTAVGTDKLVEAAQRADCTLELVPALGAFVPAGAPVFRVAGNAERLDHGELLEALIVEPERTLDEDVAYGIRLLVDIAERSLSESPLQDPSTAVQAIDRIHDILRQLAPRPFPDGHFYDDAGERRLTMPTMSWDEYVELAFQEIRLAGGDSPQIARRLQAALDDLLSVAPPTRRGALQRQLGGLPPAATLREAERGESTRLPVREAERIAR